MAVFVCTNAMHSPYINCKGKLKSHSPFSPSKVVLLLWSGLRTKCVCVCATTLFRDTQATISSDSFGGKGKRIINSTEHGCDETRTKQPQALFAKANGTWVPPGEGAKPLVSVLEPLAYSTSTDTTFSISDQAIWEPGRGAPNQATQDCLSSRTCAGGSRASHWVGSKASHLARSSNKHWPSMSSSGKCHL